MGEPTDDDWVATIHDLLIEQMHLLRQLRDPNVAGVDAAYVARVETRCACLSTEYLKLMKRRLAA